MTAIYGYCLIHPLAGDHVINLANAMLRLAGIKNSDIETFPKQSKASKLAGGIRLPLGIHRKPGADNCRGYLNLVRQKDIESQLAWLATQPLNDTDVAVELAEEHKPVVLLPIKRKTRGCL